MNLNAEETRAFLAKHRPPPAPPRAAVNMEALNQAISQAKVMPQYLSADPVWRVFQQILQHSINVCQEEHDRVLKAIVTQGNLKPTDILRKRDRAVRLHERIEAWKLVLALPNEIKTVGEAAAEQIKLHERAETSTTST